MKSSTRTSTTICSAAARNRTFANITYRQPGYIATGTVRAQTHSWFSETEQTPEATFHYLERPLVENLYFSFDTANGYYNREPYGVDWARTANTARLTYSWDPTPGLAITPFWEADGDSDSRERQSDTSAGLLSTNMGVTVQTRLHLWRSLGLFRLQAHGCAVYYVLLPARHQRIPWRFPSTTRWTASSVQPDRDEALECPLWPRRGNRRSLAGRLPYL